MEDVSLRNSGTQNLLSAAYEKFHGCELNQGIIELEKALSLDFEDSEVVSSLKCANYWRDRFATAKDLSGEFERAEYLMSQWKGFLNFANRIGTTSEPCLSAFKRLVYRTCLGLYENLLAGHSGGSDADILLRIGRCYKGLGSYDKALEVLDPANQLKKDSPEILAELADCYALVNEMHISKVFFREAFFLNPLAIDISVLESEMICRLVSKLQEIGYTEPVLAEWLPVYGVLYGVFTVKRELRSIEYGKLRQSIYALEVDLRENPKKKETIMPRLLNRYFWLIDHYISAKENRDKIDEVLLKIKELSPALYDQYTK
jgi:tetratricopeptide (TPR) repeat protein